MRAFISTPSDTSVSPFVADTNKFRAADILNGRACFEVDQNVDCFRDESDFDLR